MTGPAIPPGDEELREALWNALVWLETGFPDRAEATLRRALDGDQRPAGFCTCLDDAPMRDCGIPRHRATARALRGDS